MNDKGKSIYIYIYIYIKAGLFDEDTIDKEDGTKQGPPLCF